MRDGEVISYERLRQEAAAAAEKWTGLKQDLADELGVTPSTLSRALNNAGGSYAALQRRIIARFTPYEVEEKPLFRVRKRQ